MRRVSSVLFVLLIALLALGCGQKRVATDVEATGAEQEAAAGEQAKEGEQVEEVKVSEEAPITSEEAESPTMVARRTPAARIEGPVDVYFDFDRYNVKEKGRQKLLALSDAVINTKASIIIEGHCDERGTNEYNLALGDRRANAVKEFLTASGVSPGKIEAISFGEEKPACSESAESCWWQNRRAHVIAEGMQ
jgi:peptidoglycan-associated lipoprotein